MPMKVIVVGGGAAGFFGAIACAEANPGYQVTILEKTRQLLTKVKISGGGRCNVTHACFDPAVLVLNYPRGQKALRGPFSQFQPRDTIHWFESRGVKLKTEADGRMFPVTDSSQTIIDILMHEAKRKNIAIQLETNVSSISYQANQGFRLETKNDQVLGCDRLLIATGSNPSIYAQIQSLGHTIVPLVPSLFTFNIPESPLHDLSGVSIPNATLKIEGTALNQNGPLLITHWGFSGPAVLKLSAFGARILHEMNYKANLIINWIPSVSQEEVLSKLVEAKSTFPARQVSTECPYEFPKSLWKKLVELSGIAVDQRYAAMSKLQMQALVKILTADRYNIDGKSVYKDEFVTCGGVALEEVNFKTMESKLCPGLFFAGEVLDIDGVTGGFNFQNAWTTSWIAGKNI